MNGTCHDSIYLHIACFHVRFWSAAVKHWIEHSEHLHLRLEYMEYGVYLFQRLLLLIFVGYVL